MAEPAACPSWCYYEHSSSTSHMSQGNLVTLPSEDTPPREQAHLVAYAAADDGSAPGVVLYVRNAGGTSEGTGVLPVRAASAIARLVELLADAPPEEHRKVAEAIREAIREGKGT